LSLPVSHHEREPGAGEDHATVMAVAEAIRLAQATIGATAPNPPVGCVVLDAAGRQLASAAHMGAGTAHAEAAALEACRLSGRIDAAHTLVVTLEPCNHHGRTGPCTQAILASPVRQVIFGVADPNPEVAGGGQVRLRKAGLRCEALSDALPDQGHLADQCADLIAPFAKHCREGLPWVTVKEVRDRNGSMIPPPGCKTFSSDASLDHAHLLRRRSDAIMTGVGTVLADAPLLTVRRVDDHPNRRRHLVIMDRSARTPASYLMAAWTRGLDPMVGQDIETSLRELARKGCLSVLVEAGPLLTQAILATDFWDERVLIRQGASATDPDTIDVERRCDRHAGIDRAAPDQERFN
jgi:diaminohydroxyphosphoribosylaminopyrimidine deaminase/5-amino-6-(5-phosphoribosylamino)uracil reductase